MEITPIPFPIRAPRKAAWGGRARALRLAREGCEAFWRALVARTRRHPKSLVMLESSPLGDRRFVSVIQFERQRFLIGSSPSSVTLLARLPNAGSFPVDDVASAAEGASQ
jgi:hypothetical protein